MSTALPPRARSARIWFPPRNAGRIILTVKSAHNMLDKAWLGKSDPYCVIRLADAEIQTHHVKNAGEHCTWDESVRGCNCPANSRTA